jgi:membrane-bound ClpP family serine protease
MGEIWNAESFSGKISKSKKIVVESGEGLELYVRKK